MNKREVGFKYENVAKEYLILQGLVFVESNFYTKFGEIDLIFFEKSSQTLVFVEVKYRRNDFFGSAIEMVTEEKQNRILVSSQVYLLKKNWDRNVRYDVVGVSKDSGNIEWLKNAFWGGYMRNDEKCCKCGMDIFEIKKVAIPTKKAVGAKIAIDTFYLKICKNCGYTEMYSTKIIQKVEDPV